MCYCHALAPARLVYDRPRLKLIFYPFLCVIRVAGLRIHTMTQDAGVFGLRYLGGSLCGRGVAGTDQTVTVGGYSCRV